MTGALAAIVAVLGAIVLYFRQRAKSADEKAARSEADKQSAQKAAAEMAQRHDQATTALHAEVAAKQETLNAVMASHPELAREYLAGVLASVGGAPGATAGPVPQLPTATAAPDHPDGSRR